MIPSISGASPVLRPTPGASIRTSTVLPTRSRRRWGDGDAFLERIERIRSAEPAAVFRSNFLIGYPGAVSYTHLTLPTSDLV